MALPCVGLASLSIGNQPTDLARVLAGARIGGTGGWMDERTPREMSADLVCVDRKELWAAIDGYGQCRYDDGFADNDGGFGWTKMEAHACLEKRRHIRSLLGMEAEQ